MAAIMLAPTKLTNQQSNIHGWSLFLSYNHSKRQYLLHPTNLNATPAATVAI